MSYNFIDVVIGISCSFLRLPCWIGFPKGILCGSFWTRWISWVFLRPIAATVRTARSEFRLMCGCCNLLKIWRAVLAGGRWRRMGTSLLEKGKTTLATAVLTEKTLNNRLCSANMLMIGNVPLEIAVIELC